MNQQNAPLAMALERECREVKSVFTIPGHHRGAGASRWWDQHGGRGFLQFDGTETMRTDDLHAPEGAILEAQQLAAEAFGADAAFFLVNGTTCGIEAMLLATAGPGQCVILPRHAHKSALMGLILTGAEPVYVMPEQTEDGAVGGVYPAAIAAALEAHATPAAVLMVHPTYDGYCSDLTAIAALCHAREIPLITDEAHGAHFALSPQLPPPALACGADATVQSFHKTMGAMTQSSMLLQRGGRLDLERLRSALHLVQSTSPSYLLMLSLDLARREMALHGAQDWARTLEVAERLRRELNQIPGIRCADPRNLIGDAAIAAADPTRLRIDATELGLSGFALLELAGREFGIDFELADWRAATAILSWATAESELTALRQMLEHLPRGTALHGKTMPMPHNPPMAALPREAFFAPSRSVSWRNALGCISAETVIPYPPGIPVLCPGERITPEVWDYLESCRGHGLHLQGVADSTLTTIRII